MQSKEQNGSVNPLSGDELHLLQMINILQSPKEEGSVKVLDVCA